MNKDFISYGHAIELKELGYNEICFGFYPDKNSPVVLNYAKNCCGDYEITETKDLHGWVIAPLYQQAFRWFMENYGLYGHIDYSPELGKWVYKIHDINQRGLAYDLQDQIDPIIETLSSCDFGEAQLLCLRNLIMEVKEKKSLL